MKITYKDHEEVDLKYSIRAMIMFENVSNKTFQAGSITDVVTLFYCMVSCTLKDYTIKYDEFLDWCDENPLILGEFSQWFVQTQIQQDKLKKKQTKVSETKKRAR